MDPAQIYEKVMCLWIQQKYEKAVCLWIQQQYGKQMHVYGSSKHMKK